MEVEKWPTGSLDCLIPESKCHVDNIFYNTLTSNVESMISFDRFSDFNKLYNVTAFVYKLLANSNA